jgi:hypothetical protein
LVAVEIGVTVSDDSLTTYAVGLGKERADAVTGEAMASAGAVATPPRATAMVITNQAPVHSLRDPVITYPPFPIAVALAVRDWPDVVDRVRAGRRPEG